MYGSNDLSIVDLSWSYNGASMCYDWPHVDWLLEETPQRFLVPRNMLPTPVNSRKILTWCCLRPQVVAG